MYGQVANNHDAMAIMMVAATMRGGHWCQCNDVTISHNEVKSHEWQQRHCWRMRGCSGSCICGQEAYCQWTGNRSGKKALADSNGKGSEDNDNKSNNDSKGNKGEGDKGKGNEGNDGNFPKEEGRR